MQDAGNIRGKSTFNTSAIDLSSTRNSKRSMLSSISTVRFLSNNLLSRAIPIYRHWHIRP